MNILLVDDDPILVASIGIGLKQGGHQIIEAYDGQQALDLLDQRECTIEMVISDHMMPTISGMDLLKAIRKNYPTLPFILMTSYAEVGLVINAIKYQCSSFIEKPFSCDQLLSEISRVTNIKPCKENHLTSEESLSEIARQMDKPLATIVDNICLLINQADTHDLQRHLEAIAAATCTIADINRKILNLPWRKK